jgi:hypothetical protein
MILVDTHPCGRRNLYFGSYLLEIPRGHEPARLLGLIWEDKSYTENTVGPTSYERKRQHASRGFLGSCELRTLLPRKRRKSFLNA